MNYKVGDKVKVREDLSVFGDYGNLDFDGRMKKYMGEHHIIQRVNDDETYSLDVIEDIWYFNDEMLEPVVEDKQVEESIDYSKLYKGWQIAKMISEGVLEEGTEIYCKYTDETLFTGKLVLWDSKNKAIEVSASYFCNDTEDFKIIKPIKEFTFVEAWKAYQEGKTILSIYSDRIYKKYTDGMYFSVIGKDTWDKSSFMFILEIENQWQILE